MLCRLHAVRLLVEGLEEGASAPIDSPAPDSAAIAARYGVAPAIVRRRFDALATETASVAATGIEALLRARARDADPRAAAQVLATELRRATSILSRLLIP